MFEKAKEDIGCFGEYNWEWCERIEWADKAAYWLIALNLAAIFCVGAWILLLRCSIGWNKCKKAFLVFGIGVKAAAIVVWVGMSGVRFSDQCEFLVVDEKVVTGCARFGISLEVFLSFLYVFMHLAIAVIF